MSPDTSPPFAPFVQLVSHCTILLALDDNGTVWRYDELYYDYESVDETPRRVWRPLPAERVDK